MLDAFWSLLTAETGTGYVYAGAMIFATLAIYMIAAHLLSL